MLEMFKALEMTRDDKLHGIFDLATVSVKSLVIVNNSLIACNSFKCLFLKSKGKQASSPINFFHASFHFLTVC